MFSEEDVREMGRTAMGVKSVSLRKGDSVVGIGIARPDNEVLVISENGYGKRTPIDEYKLQKRGGIGIKTLRVTDKTGDMCALKIVDGTEDIMLINDAGIIIRMMVNEISVIGRDTQGVRLMNVGDDAKSGFGRFGVCGRGRRGRRRGSLIGQRQGIHIFVVTIAIIHYMLYNAVIHIEYGKGDCFRGSNGFPTEINICIPSDWHGGLICCE